MKKLDAAVPEKAPNVEVQTNFSTRQLSPLAAKQSGREGGGEWTYVNGHQQCYSSVELNDVCKHIKFYWLNTIISEKSPMLSFQTNSSVCEVSPPECKTSEQN